MYEAHCGSVLEERARTTYVTLTGTQTNCSVISALAVYDLLD